MTRDESHEVVIVGAGLCGSLLSIALQRELSQPVHLYERGEDIRRDTSWSGRSINLALSARGLHALKQVGLDDEVRKIGIPMYGRLMHDTNGNTTYQAYGHSEDCNLSVSRKHLNEILLTHAEEAGVNVHFEHQLTSVEIKNEQHLTFTSPGGYKSGVNYKYLLATDGAYSAIRSKMQRTGRFNYDQYYIPHGYKELTMPPTKDGDYALRADCLHIWPRKNFMMIALPNLDKSFTVTLFMSYDRHPDEAEDSICNFNALGSDRDLIARFFREQFADALPHMPDPVQDYLDNPTGSLVQIQCSPWNYGENVCLLGDAAHAMVPFHGQGMNAAFQDTAVFMETFRENNNDLAASIPKFAKKQKPNGDAIQWLSMHNYIVMRDSVAKSSFLLRQAFEKFLNTLLPNTVIPMYMMTAFHAEIPYAEVISRSERQEKMLDRLFAGIPLTIAAGAAGLFAYRKFISQ